MLQFQFEVYPFPLYYIILHFISMILCFTAVPEKVYIFSVIESL